MLQFRCPYCQAVIRVPNSAMGQSGICQKCGQKILVPVVKTESGSNQEQPVQQEEISRQEQIAGRQQVSEQPQKPVSEDQAVSELLSALSSAEATQGEQDPILDVARRGSTSNQSFLLTGLFFLLIGGIGAIAVYLLSQPQMQGELTAQVVPVNAIKPMLIGRQAIGQPDLFETFWLRNPDKKIEINSRLLETSILAQKRGLEIRIYPGPENELYRVDLLQNKPLNDYCTQHLAELEKERKKILIQSTVSFLEQMVAKEEILRKNSRLLIEIRNRMVLTAMVHGLGFRLVALVGEKQYPCVWQDKQDRLYFVLPKGTPHFVVREADRAGQKKMFPETMRFRISTPYAKMETRKKASAEQSPSEEDETKNVSENNDSENNDSEMNDTGMNDTERGEPGEKAAPEKSGNEENPANQSTEKNKPEMKPDK